jgi:hypothetical protein
MLGFNLGPLQLWHWQCGPVTIRLNLIHTQQYSLAITIESSLEESLYIFELLTSSLESTSRGGRLETYKAV